jgi:ankyrin repeat protein
MSKEARLEKMNEELHEAIFNDDLKKIQKLLKKGADVNGRSEHGATPLYRAVLACDTEMAKLFLDSGADANELEEVRGRYMLHESVERGSVLVADILVNRGADVNARDREGNTPLHTVVLSRSDNLTAFIRTDIVNFLLNRGADVNARDNLGHTPLFWLLPNPPFPSIDCADEVAAILREHGGITGAEEAGATSRDLRDAISNGDLDEARKLLDDGVDVNAGDKDGMTPLHSAVWEGNSEMAALLLARGAKVNARAEGGYTPLHTAALRGNSEMAAFLLDNGADVNARSDKGGTPLLQASLQISNAETAELLRQRGGVQ